MTHLGDITKINGAAAPPVNVVIGGSPCQDLSIAGKRAGLAGERSGLFMEQIRIIKEMRENDKRAGRSDELVRPRFMVWENVPGAFSSNKGEDFRAVLEETARVVDKVAAIPRPPRGKWSTSGAVVGDGWSIAWRVLDAQLWGVPQRRRRIALVADFGGLAAPEILFERESVCGNIEACGAQRQGAAADSENGAGAADLQSGIVYDARGNGDGSLSPTLTGDHESRKTDYTAICIQGNCIDRADTAGCNGKGWAEDVCYTLNTIDRPAVAYVIGNGQADQTKLSEKVGALNCMHDQQIVMYPKVTAGLHDASIVYSIDRGISSTLVSRGPSAVAYKIIRWIVRRLTPLECERLQGFPDGWTDIGDWTDSNGKVHKSSDNARYKAIGNSIALPPWAYVLQRLSICCGDDITMASLFDGIGGFPLIWERLNGAGSCLWASEIEEFPIAVTKHRFGGDENTP